MKQHITLREANQNFSRCIEAVEKGAEYVVTRRGKPVAIMAPVPRRPGRSLDPARKRVLARLFEGARALHVKKWRRDDLYGNAEDIA